MDVTRTIQAAVAMADLIAVRALRVGAALLAAGAVAGAVALIWRMTGGRGGR